MTHALFSSFLFPNNCFLGLVYFVAFTPPSTVRFECQMCGLNSCLVTLEATTMEGHCVTVIICVGFIVFGHLLFFSVAILNEIEKYMIICCFCDSIICYFSGWMKMTDILSFFLKKFLFSIFFLFFFFLFFFFFFNNRIIKNIIF